MYQRPLSIVILALCGSAAAPHALALGFGRIPESLVYGQALDLSVPLRLEPGESLSPACLNAELSLGEQRLPKAAVRLQLEGMGRGRRGRPRAHPQQRAGAGARGRRQLVGGLHRPGVTAVRGVCGPARPRSLEAAPAAVAALPPAAVTATTRRAHAGLASRAPPRPTPRGRKQSAARRAARRTRQSAHAARTAQSIAPRSLAQRPTPCRAASEARGTRGSAAGRHPGGGGAGCGAGQRRAGGQRGPGGGLGRRAAHGGTGAEPAGHACRCGGPPRGDGPDALAPGAGRGPEPHGVGAACRGCSLWPPSPLWLGLRLRALQRERRPVGGKARGRCVARGARHRQRMRAAAGSAPGRRHRFCRRRARRPPSPRDADTPARPPQVVSPSPGRAAAGRR